VNEEPTVNERMWELRALTKGPLKAGQEFTLKCFYERVGDPSRLDEYAREFELYLLATLADVSDRALEHAGPSAADPWRRMTVQRTEPRSPSVEFTLMPEADGEHTVDIAIYQVSLDGQKLARPEPLPGYQITIQVDPA
jgi:hypothetical protein